MPDPAGSSSRYFPTLFAPSTLPPAASARAEKPSPLPLHGIEDNGGIFWTLSACLVGLPRNGGPADQPSIGLGYITMGYGRDRMTLTVTQTP